MIPTEQSQAIIKAAVEAGALPEKAIVVVLVFDTTKDALDIGSAGPTPEAGRFALDIVQHAVDVLSAGTVVAKVTERFAVAKKT